MADVNPETEALIVEYLGREARDAKAGFDKKSILEAVDRVSTNFQEFSAAQTKKWEENDREHKSIHRRLSSLESTESKVHSATAPSPGVAEAEDPAAITGVHDLKSFAQDVKKAVQGGEGLEEVIEKKQRELEDKKEFKRLKLAEEQRKVEDEKRKDDEERVKRENRKAVVLTVVGIVGGAGGLLLLDLIGWLRTLHH